ncbi:MAG: hypothetical protein IJZ39_11200 [Oscillospiraceae bacterium]|nr:hypothetical protein [Oscillospiraceae bacterium]
MGIRTLLLAAMALVMLTVIVLTWGSLGSFVLVFCLIMMAASLTYQHYLTNRDADEFRDE